MIEEDRPHPPQQKEEDDSEEDDSGKEEDDSEEEKTLEQETPKQISAKWIPLDQVWKSLSEYRWNLRLVGDRFSLLSFYEYYKLRHFLEDQVDFSSALRIQRHNFERYLGEKSSNSASFRGNFQCAKESSLYLASLFSEPPDFSPSPFPTRGFTDYSVLVEESPDEDKKKARVVFASNHRPAFLTVSIESESCGEYESCRIDVEALGKWPAFCLWDFHSEGYRNSQIASRRKIIRRLQYLLPEDAKFWEDENGKEEEKMSREKRIVQIERDLKGAQSEEKSLIENSYEDCSLKERKFIETLFEQDLSDSEGYFWDTFNIEDKRKRKV